MWGEARKWGVGQLSIHIPVTGDRQSPVSWGGTWTRASLLGHGLASVGMHPSSSSLAMLGSVSILGLPQHPALVGASSNPIAEYGMI